MPPAWRHAGFVGFQKGSRIFFAFKTGRRPVESGARSKQLTKPVNAKKIA
jgi:hypothetical protein